MFRCSVDPPGRVLVVSYSGHITPACTKRCLEEIRVLIDQVKPGFFLFTDLSNLESMDVECAHELGAIMELCESKGLANSIRVVPDKTKDIGLAVISHFHYSPAVRFHAFETMADALGCLLSESSEITAAT
jgi:hypothetical protein